MLAVSCMRRGVLTMPIWCLNVTKSFKDIIILILLLEFHTECLSLVFPYVHNIFMLHKLYIITMADRKCVYGRHLMCFDDVVKDSPKVTVSLLNTLHFSPRRVYLRRSNRFVFRPVRLKKWRLENFRHLHNYRSDHGSSVFFCYIMYKVVE